MLKKFLCTMLVALLISSCAYAQTSAEITDVSNDIVTVSTTSTVGDPISVMILNPGFSKEDALLGSDGAIQYFNYVVPSSSNTEIPVKIMGNSGGKFKVYVKSSKGEETADFTFYNSVFKQKCIDDINSASSGEDITVYFENLVNAYGKSEDETYKSLGSKAVSDAFLLLRDTMPGKVLPADIEEVFELINRSFILAAYNSKRSDFCFSGDSILNADIIGISSSDELADYNANLSVAGKEYIRQKMLDGGYKNIDDIASKFKTLVHRGVLLNYKQFGYGHIHSYLSVKYRTSYEKAGFIIPSTENQSKYLQLLSLTDERLEDMAVKFNGFKDTASNENTRPSSRPGSGNSGSVGGNVSIGGGTSYVDPNPAPITPPVQISPVFSDVTNNHWAQKPIEFLKEKGWINGYEDGTFRPDNNITRAEYTKLILTVFGIKEGGDADFNDVSKDSWYAPFVAAAKANGIINGTDGNFMPENKLTRQDAAVIICRLLNKTSDGTPDFADAHLIADYAAPSVAYLADLGVINGYSDNTFKPQGYITRAEISKIIYTLYEKGGINQ